MIKPTWHYSINIQGKGQEMEERNMRRRKGKRERKGERGREREGRRGRERERSSDNIHSYD